MAREHWRDLPDDDLRNFLARLRELFASDSEGYRLDGDLGAYYGTETARERLERQVERVLRVVDELHAGHVSPLRDWIAESEAAMARLKARESRDG